MGLIKLRQSWLKVLAFFAIHVAAIVATIFLIHTNIEPSPAALRLDSAMFHTANTKPTGVILPDSWRDGERNKQRQGKYVFRFESDTAPTSVWAVLIPMHRFSASISINGKKIGDTGVAGSKISRNHYIPALITAPSAMFKPGANTMTIVLNSDPVGLGFIEPVLIGPYSELASDYRRMKFARNTIVQLLALGVFLLGGVTAVLFLNRATKPEYAYFSALCWAWAIHMSNRFWADPPFPTEIWERIVFLSVFWFAVFSLLFAHSVSLEANRRLHQGIIFSAAVVTVIFVLLPFPIFMNAGEVGLMPVSFIIGAAAVTLFIMHAWTERSGQRLFYSVTGLIALTTAVYDLAVVTNLNHDSIDFYLQYSAAPLIGGVGFMLIRRFIDSINQLDEFNRNLEATLSDRQSALERSYARQEAAQLHAAALEERERVMRDLHDGLGARLATLAHIADGSAPDGHVSANAVRDAARAALRELRFFAAPLRMEEPEITAILALFREERLRPLEASGLTVCWDVDDILPPPGFSMAKAAHFLKILDETLSNALHHGDGKDITISLKSLDGRVVLLIQNGVSVVTSPETPGAGLRNITSRAELIGAEIRSGFEKDRFIISISWPASVTKPR